MSRQLQRVLEQLIPRHSGALPQELIDLANSLLAQSRSKISNLKPQEESSRTYTCANIACERLKTSLNLPKIEPRPPCPPKVYKSLYEYFDRALVPAASRKRTRHSDGKEPERALPQRHTPSKEKSFQGFRTNRRPKQGLKYGSNKRDQEVPRWIGPAIRFICKEVKLGYETVAPHAHAGVESVLFLPVKEANGWDEKDTMEGKTPAMVAAVMISAMVAISGTPPHQFDYEGHRDKLLDLLNELRENPQLIAKVGITVENWEGWEEVTTYDVDNWNKEIAKRGWTDMEWHKNALNDTGWYKEQGDGSGDDEADQVEDGMSDEETPAKRMESISQDPALGRMVQNSSGFWIEDKRKDYEKWKMLMLAKIDAMPPLNVLDDKMDVDEE